MRILVTGNLGYVGPCVTRHLRRERPDCELFGLDAGYFAHCLTGAAAVPERRLDRQYFADVRSVDPRLFEDVDAVVHLAAISNDPIGHAYRELTFDVNHQATIAVARTAKAAGVRAFVFASSCSLYGRASHDEVDERSPVDPLTAYAESKVLAERDLASVADDGFVVTSLRFATACGMSDRLRLDLVLNDFVASAVSSGRITLLSDGSAWRPLIHVGDMARALDWAIERPADHGGACLVVNAGSDDWNFRIRALAEAVASVLPSVEVDFAPEAPPDQRSYRVSFARFRELAPHHQPRETLASAVADLAAGLERLNFGEADTDFRSSLLVRLVALQRLRQDGLLTDALHWVDAGARREPLEYAGIASPDG